VVCPSASSGHPEHVKGCSLQSITSF